MPYNSKFYLGLPKFAAKKWHNRIPKMHFNVTPTMNPAMTLPQHPEFLQHSPCIELPIIGYIRSPLSQKFGIPRQPNLVKTPAIIELIPPFDTVAAFNGLENFSHLWLIWQFHHNKAQDSFKPQVRPPRLGGNEKIGVFATRSMYRPASIGLSVVKLEKIDSREGKVRLHISGADMVDGTPIVDIKPYIGYSDSISEAKSGFAENSPVPKRVVFSDNFHQQYSRICQQNLNQISLNTADLSEHLAQLDYGQSDDTSLAKAANLTQEDLGLIEQLIAQDPRPAYRQHEIHRIFTMRYKAFDIGFFMDTYGSLVIDTLLKVLPSD